MATNVHLVNDKYIYIAIGWRGIADDDQSKLNHANKTKEVKESNFPLQNHITVGQTQVRHEIWSHFC